jgi:hypothetical protein
LINRRFTNNKDFKKDDKLAQLRGALVELKLKNTQNLSKEEITHSSYSIEVAKVVEDLQSASDAAQKKASFGLRNRLTVCCII